MVLSRVFSCAVIQTLFHTVDELSCVAARSKALEWSPLRRANSSKWKQLLTLCDTLIRTIET